MGQYKGMRFVVRRATGERISTQYYENRESDGVWVYFYNTQSGRDEKYPKYKFDLLFRVEVGE